VATTAAALGDAVVVVAPAALGFDAADEAASEHARPLRVSNPAATAERTARLNG
jgi:hypothetical protein